MYPGKPQLSADQRWDKSIDAIKAQSKAGDKLVSKVAKDGDMKDFTRKIEENTRETGTHNATYGNMTTDQLDALAAKGHPTEASGDALTRAQHGIAPKMHED